MGEWDRFVREHGLPPAAAGLPRSMGRFRSHTFVNCWYRGEWQSPAMWKQYGRGGNEAVAVRTTFEKLTGVLPERVYVGIVHYVDFDRFPIRLTNSMWPFVFKRKNFETERELRAVVQRPPLGPEGGIDLSQEPLAEGLLIDVALSELIDAVCLAPGVEDWFAELVAALLRRYGVEVPVLRSELDARPAF